MSIFSRIESLSFLCVLDRVYIEFSYFLLMWKSHLLLRKWGQMTFTYNFSLIKTSVPTNFHKRLTLVTLMHGNMFCKVVANNLWCTSILFAWASPLCVCWWLSDVLKPLRMSRGCCRNCFLCVIFFFMMAITSLHKLNSSSLKCMVGPRGNLTIFMWSLSSVCVKMSRWDTCRGPAMDTKSLSEFFLVTLSALAVNGSITLRTSRMRRLTSFSTLPRFMTMVWGAILISSLS